MNSADSHAPLIPIHGAQLDAQGRVLRVARLPGRPRIARRAPDADERQYLVRLAVERDRALVTDAVVQAVGADDDDNRLLQAVALEVARETAALRWDREHAEPGSDEAAQLCSRRITGLLRLADLQVALAHARAGDVDLDDPRVKAVVEYFIATVGQVATETLGENADPVMARLRAATAGWALRFT